MKKILGIVLGLGVAAGTNASAVEVDKLALVSAIGSLAGELMADIPKLIKDIPQFPDKVKATAGRLKQGFADAAKIPVGKERDAKIQELFVIGVSLLIDVNNIIDNVLGIVKKFGPIISAIDKTNGEKVEKAIFDIANVLYMVTKIAEAQQGVVARANPTLQKPANQAVPEVPDL